MLQEPRFFKTHDFKTFFCGAVMTLAVQVLISSATNIGWRGGIAWLRPNPNPWPRQHLSPLKCNTTFENSESLRQWANSEVEKSPFGFTDKFIWHGYAHPYWKYLNGHQCSNPKLLEIGLGVGERMGASAIFWRTFLGPKAEIHVLTYDRVQAMAWMKQNPGIVDKMFTGDQGDLEVLGRVISEGGANYDIMVDDGSHRSVHQIIAVKTFLPTLKSGAKMFIEDVHVYNDPSYRAHNWI